jgi:uncharacterized protein YbjT (DUF2867 family)
MRIFLAGASGVIGIRLVPLLVAGGHAVTGTTRSPGRVAGLEAAGAEAVVCDVYDAAALRDAVVAAAPDLVMHQLTDLPDDAGALGDEARERNARMRSAGTRNLLAAAAAAGAPRFLAQSIAWDGGPVVAEHERLVLAVDGVVLRYGQYYGPGTYYEQEPPPPPRVQIDTAARRTVELLDAPSGIVEILD